MSGLEVEGNNGVEASRGAEEEDDVENGEEDEEAEEASVASEDTVEPDYDKANSLSFALVCKRMEQLWQLKRKRGRKVSDLEKKKYLLPATLLKAMEPQSVFPLFRLLLPDIDNARNTNMKEKLIAQCYCSALGISKGTTTYEMLYGFTDPQKVPHTMAGDLSLVVQHVLEQRIPTKPSKVTLGQINQLLDDLATLGKQSRRSHTHEWRDSQNQQTTKKAKKKESLVTLREEWMRSKVMSKGLSPLEHKWMVRILLQKPEFGLGWRAIFAWYSQYAMELWNSHNSLKNLCDKLADPLYTKRRQAQDAMQQAMTDGVAVASRWEPQNQPASLGNTISPMLSSRVSFANCRTQLESNHKEFLKTSSSQLHLALKFPSICAEIKLDGERMVVHVTNDGTVTMHTRNSKWYSQLYSPVLGPPLRRALSNYNVNVILDGEIESWDNGRQELIPFGSNRTIGNYRRAYLQRHGMLDDRDRNLHHNDTITNSSIMRAADDNRFVKKSKNSEQVEGEDDPGKDCWLQFIVFDILYVDGPDAKKLWQDCGLLADDVVQSTGSIVHLTGLQRKQILYRLLEEQPNEIEICQAVVIRSNGECVRGEKYFSTKDPLMECGHLATVLDSTQAAIQGNLENLEDLDRQRRNGKSNLEISRMRSQAIDDFYRHVVEVHRMEGLVLKDLAAPYIFGTESRSRKYWHKFKPDYEKEGGGAVDIDVVILGAYFATGLRHSGKLNSFLCGCVDSDDASTFMTLCNVSGGSVKNEELDMIMKATGFQKATADEDMQPGKWYEEETHGKSLPNFISTRSLQRGEEDFDGWKFTRNKNYPDLWIHPEDSVVLTIHGQELVQSEEYSAGVSLRFARISKVRHENVHGDAKAASEIDSDQDLWQTYLETMRQRQECTAAGDSSVFSPSKVGQIQTSSTCRFLTPEEFGRKSKKRKRNIAVSPSRIPKVETQKSRALEGVAFTVLEGNYSLDRNSLEAQEARDQGWLDEVLRVKRKEDVMEFILSHGGTIKVSADSSETFILGGSENDARVVHCMKGIEYARSSQNVGKSKTKKGLQLQKMAEYEGVLKWTFVFSLVLRWIFEQSKVEESREVERTHSSSSIKQTSDWMLSPKKHHYLAKSTTKEGVSDEIFSLTNAADATTIELMRALEDFGANGIEHLDSAPWQYTGSWTLAAQDRWILAARHQTLWPYQDGARHTKEEKVVMYPDVFQHEVGIQDEKEAINELLAGIESARWNGMVGESCDQIASSLPLARAMGALVTPYLHSGVTHIICDLKDGLESLAYHGNVSDDAFNNMNRGKRLVDRLKEFEVPIHVTFVSPKWVRSLWLHGI
jgi:ATP-dependent DNA ligase